MQNAVGETKMHSCRSAEPQKVEGITGNLEREYRAHDPQVESKPGPLQKQRGGCPSSELSPLPRLPRLPRLPFACNEPQGPAPKDQ
jgi:hypothetical protein